MTLQKAKLIKKKILNNEVFELVFTKKEFEFLKGQFVNIKINDGGKFPCFRAYSISGQKNKNEFELCIKIIKNGRGSNWLNNLKINDEIEFIGPIGKFVLENKENNISFIATGTGIAPFKAIIEEQLSNGFTKNINLLFGVRNKEDIFYKDLFEELSKKHKNFNFFLTLSRADESWNGRKGRVTEHLKEIINKNDDIYICGLKAMIDSVTEILEKANFPKTQIFFEKFD